MELIEIYHIEKLVYKGEVIDLSIEDDESYNVENHIVHNSACTTYPSTGFGSRNCQASTIYNCSLVSNLPIIGDGGIKTPGDIAKALTLGATIVMVGGMMSGYNDSPGDIVEINGKQFKEFWGSASSFQSGKSNRIEGKKTLVDFKNQSILDGLKYIEECLQSSISYAGGKDLTAFDNLKWI